MYEFDILNKYNIKHSFNGKPNDYSEGPLNVYRLKQVHSDKVVTIEANDKVEDFIDVEADGLITNVKGRYIGYPEIKSANALPMPDAIPP